MTDSYLPWLAAAISALKSDATLSGLVGGRVYADVPDNPTFPYIEVTLTSAPFDTKTENHMDHTMQVAIYSRTPSPKVLGQIRSAVYDLFHKQNSDFESEGVSVILFTGVAPVIKDPDGQTWQCPMQFQVII